MSTGQAAAEAIYAQLWDEAQAAFAAGSVRTDPALNDRASDRRRGLTLLLRPLPPARERLTALIAELDAIAPGQHVYRADALHVTVLSLVSASEAVRLEAIPVDTYRALLADFCAGEPPFRVHFTGVCASADSVFACGGSDGDALNALRDRLRARLVQAGLDGVMEQRYRSVTTHATILRYRTIPPDLPRLAAYLAEQRTRDLGACQVDALELTFNDWFMSPDRLQTLGRYALGGPIA